MTAAGALRFVEQHGVVLVAGKGPAPRLTEAIVNEPIKGSWWAHPRSHEIFAVLQAVTDSRQVLVCRLVGGKVTLVHRRLWPALVKLAARLGPERLAKVCQVHTRTGRHSTAETPYPDWVPAGVMKSAQGLDEAQAAAALAASGIRP